jgi:hypothetical protein
MSMGEKDFKGKLPIPRFSSPGFEGNSFFKLAQGFELYTQKYVCTCVSDHIHNACLYTSLKEKVYSFHQILKMMDDPKWNLGKRTISVVWSS